jgi:hypothetical protein
MKRLVPRAARLSAVGCCALTLLWASATLAAGPGDAAFENHLQNGEFAPAKAQALKAQGAERDQMLGRIAAAQARAGMRGAAVRTAANIHDGSLLDGALGGISGGQVGDNFGGAAGGGADEGFEELIELIQNTVAPDTWEANGGAGNIERFEGGVRVDAGGLVHSLLKEDNSGDLVVLWRAASDVGENADVRQTSNLRKVSLPRLERALKLKLAAGEPITEDMLVLAGLQKIQYVLVYPETGDIVLAGPAGDWTTDGEGRLVGVETGRPALRLDDLIVVLRHMAADPNAPFGCSITPLKENLAKAKAYLAETADKPLKAGGRGEWMEGLRDAMGQQKVEYYGIDPRTRVGRVMFEADYRMKLVGLGLEKGTRDVTSYLDSIKLKPGENPPATGVLRWWFTLNYDAILSTASRDAFELKGQGVQVLSENEMIAEDGSRIHTGKSDHHTELFAKNFTKAFPALAEKYHVYAELQNIFDLALVCSLIESSDLPQQVNWQPTCFLDDNQYQVPLGFAPQLVESVVNHKLINKKHVVGAVSGGVRIDPASTVKTSLKVDNAGQLGSHRDRNTPDNLPVTQWWWD